MRYAIVSDIHANLSAWKTALADIADMRADRIICLGDIMGYGAEPVEVLESVYRKAYAVLMGNHDAAVCGKMSAEVFTPRAAQAIARHREQVSAAGLRWLARLPLVLDAPQGFRCTHGDFAAPAAYNYILDAEEALPSWQSVSEQLLFVGHTHCPGIHVIGKSGTPHVLPASDFTLEAGKRYIVNPGSIGYPRSREGRSTYCIYDTHARTVVFRSLPFDHESYVASLRKAGFEVEPWLAQQEAAQSIPELRERLSFAKPLAEHQYAQRVRQEARGSSRRLVWILILIGVVGFANLISVALHHRQMRQLQLQPSAMRPDYELEPIRAYPLVPPDRNLLPALPPVYTDGRTVRNSKDGRHLPNAVDADGHIVGWRYGMSDKAVQTTAINDHDGTAVLYVMHAARPAKFSLESPLITLTGTQLQAVRMRGRVWRSGNFDGTVMFQLVTYAEKPDGTLEHAVSGFEVRNTRGEPPGALSISRKIEFPKRVTHLRFRIETTFKGVLEIEQPVLTAETIRSNK